MTVRTTYQEKLRPTPAQERALDEVLWRCRTLDNTALEQRVTAWKRCRVSVTRYQQEAELKDVRADFPEYAAIHSPTVMCCKMSWPGSTRPFRRSSAG